MTISLPAYYMSDAARKKAQGDALREGLNDASKQAIGGFDRMAELQDQLERKDYGRAKDQRDESRADEKFALEKEDRKRKFAREDAEAAAKKQAKENPNLDVAVDAMDPNSGIGGAFDMIKRQLAGDEPESMHNVAEEDREAHASPDDLPEGTQVFFPSKAKKGISGPDDLKSELERARIETEKARGALLNKKLTAKPGEKSAAQKAKEQEAIDRAAITASKRKRLEEPSTPGAITPTQTSAMQKEYTGYREGKAAFQNLANTLKKYPGLMDAHMGPVESWSDEMIRRAGVAPADVTEVKTAIKLSLNDYKTAVTGAAASNDEMKNYITPVMPDAATDNLASALAKIKAHQSKIDARMGVLKQMMDAGSIYGGEESGTDVARHTDAGKAADIDFIMGQH